MNLFEGMSLQLKVLHPGLSPPSACRLRSRKQGAVQLSQDQLLELSLTRPEKDKPWREGAGTVARTGQTEPSGVRGLGEMKHQRMVPPPDAPGSPFSVDWKLKTPACSVRFPVFL